jgi:hypothetical protein
MDPDLECNTHTDNNMIVLVKVEDNMTEEKGGEDVEYSTSTDVPSTIDCETAVVPITDENVQVLTSIKSIVPLEVEKKDNSTKSLHEEIYPSVVHYFAKFGGVEGKKKPPLATFHHMMVASTLGFIGILLVSATDRWFLSTKYEVDGYGVSMLSGAYAATAGKSCAILLMTCLHHVLWIY